MSGRTGPGPGPPLAHVPTLDGWRAVAIILVLLSHGGDGILRLFVAAPFDSTHYAFLKDPIGRGGVHLFFALSGYLITTRLLAEEYRRGSVSLSGFYVRRFFRIQPAALTFLLTVAVLGSLGTIPISPTGWWSALFAFANFTLPAQTWYTVHFWSLAVEEHFYLIWPLLFVLLAPRHRLGLSIMLALAAACWSALVLQTHFTQTPYMWIRTDIEAPWLLWGCIAALALRSRTAAEHIARFAHPGTCLAAVLALAVASATLIYSPLDWRMDLVVTLFAAAATPLLFVATSRHAGSWLGRVLELAPVAWLGRISYGVYLWQQLFFVWDNDRAPRLDPWQSFPWQIVATLAIAALSYYTLEQPLLRVGHRLARRATEHPLGRIRSYLPELHLPRW